MTTLNQPERARFLQTLENDDQFRHDVRSLLLSRELLELPERFAQFTSYVTTFIERQQAFNENQQTVNERQQAVNENQQAVNERQQAVNENQQAFNERQQAFNERQQAFNERQQAFNERQQAFNENQQAFNQRTEDTLGVLKGNAARRLLNDSFETILESFQLDFVGFLVRDDLVRMARQSGLSNEVELGQRQSFYRADMVLEGIDDQGNPHYVAAEASFTADLRDTNRALRNAGFLSRMTGHVAHPLVASVVNDREVQDLVEAGTIHWLQFDPRELDAD